MFEKNDIVAIIGYFDNGKIRNHKVKLARIIEIGLHDLIVEPVNDYWKHHIIISKASCHKIPVKQYSDMPDKEWPEVNDLALYYNVSPFEKNKAPEKKVGLIASVEYIPGGNSKATLMVNGKMEEFPISKLIILEKNKTLEK